MSPLRTCGLVSVKKVKQRRPFSAPNRHEPDQAGPATRIVRDGTTRRVAHITAMPAPTSPTETIQSLFASNPSLDGFEGRVASSFLARYSTDEARAQVCHASVAQQVTVGSQHAHVDHARDGSLDPGDAAEKWHARALPRDGAGHGRRERGLQGRGQQRNCAHVRNGGRRGGAQCYTPAIDRGAHQAHRLQTDSAAGIEDYSNLQERQVFYLVSVPGETDWLIEVRPSPVMDSCAGPG